MSGRGLALGAVLCGGASRRMGRDKALIEVGGRPMALRVAAALRAGGCAGAVAVGGDAPALAGLGLVPVADRWPGQGPLAGLASAALALPAGSRLVLAPCDLLEPSPAAVRDLLAALAGAPLEADVAVPLVDGRLEWVHSAWRLGPDLRRLLADLVVGGARRLDAVGPSVRHVVAAAVGAEAVADADAPGDLPGGGEAGPAGRAAVPR